MDGLEGEGALEGGVEVASTTPQIFDAEPSHTERPPVHFKGKSDAFKLMRRVLETPGVERCTLLPPFSTCPS